MKIILDMHLWDLWNCDSFSLTMCIPMIENTCSNYLG